LTVLANLGLCRGGVSFRQDSEEGKPVPAYDHYGELSGRLRMPDAASTPPLGKVVLSNVTHGGHVGTRFNGTGIKYVAHGTEHYTIGGKHSAVNAGQFLCMSQSLEHDGEVRRGGERALGICMFVPAADVAAPGSDLFEVPLVFSAECSPLGRLLRMRHKAMVQPAANRPGLAGSLLRAVEAQLEPLMVETLGALDALPALKMATRYEGLRRLNIARGYLHGVTDRAVELPELAVHAGMSRFQLLRYFRDCFGAPPASYHRRLRLKLAEEAVERDGLTWAQAAHRFGFADGSSLSHAFRRTFGHAPARGGQRKAPPADPE
jgi:AraC-like DNA-binding protein